MALDNLEEIEEDDGFTPPVAVQFEGKIEICPGCSKPMAKHKLAELLRCAKKIDEAEPEQPSPYDLPGHWYIVHTHIGHEAKVKQILDARKDVRVHEIVEKHKLFPGYVLLRCDLSDDLWRTVRSTQSVSDFVSTGGGRPAPLSRADVEKFVLPREEEPPPPPKPNFEVFKANGIPQAPLRPPPPPAAEPEDDNAWTSLPFPTLADGEVDYEALVPFAAAMRTVLERERDEIIKRGGPIEKQNIELKEKLAQLLDDNNMLRRKLQMTAEARNNLQEQVDAQTKTIRMLRNELKGRKENNQVHLNELTDILDVVDKTRGWTREMGGNGHWQIYKGGVWVSDAAGSGGSTRVNQATRVKLKKAGLPV